MANFDRLKITLQYIAPKHFMSRAMGKFASARAGWLTRMFTQWFVSKYNVDMSEAIEEDPRVLIRLLMSFSLDHSSPMHVRWSQVMTS